MKSRALHSGMNSARPAITNQDTDIDVDTLDLTPCVAHSLDLSGSNAQVDPLITSVHASSTTEGTPEDNTSLPVSASPPASPTLPRASPRKEALNHFRTGQAPNNDVHISNEFGSDSDPDYDDNQGDDANQGLMTGGPNSPISHAFKCMHQMTLSTSPPPALTPVITQPAPFDDSLIDPVLLEKLGQPPSDTSTLQASTAGFIYNPHDNPFATRSTDKAMFGRPPINSFTFLTSASSRTAPSLPQLPATQGLDATTALQESGAQPLTRPSLPINAEPGTQLSTTPAAELRTSTPPDSIASLQASTKPLQTAEPPTSTPSLPSSHMPPSPPCHVPVSMDYQVAGATISTALSSNEGPPLLNRRIIKPRPIQKPKTQYSPNVIGVQDGVLNKENIAPPTSDASEGQLTQGQKATRTRTCQAAEAEALAAENEAAAGTEANTMVATAGAAGAEVNAAVTSTEGNMVVGNTEASATAGEEEVVAGMKRKEPDDGLTARRSGCSVRPPKHWEPEGRKTKKRN
jgi:hypothetical protein